jgi:hypothetical protein
MLVKDVSPNLTTDFNLDSHAIIILSLAKDLVCSIACNLPNALAKALPYRLAKRKEEKSAGNLPATSAYLQPIRNQLFIKAPARNAYRG